MTPAPGMDHGTKPVSASRAPGHCDWFRQRHVAWTGPTRVGLKTVIENAKSKTVFLLEQERARSLLWELPEATLLPHVVLAFG